MTKFLCNLPNAYRDTVHNLWNNENVKCIPCIAANKDGNLKGEKK